MHHAGALVGADLVPGYHAMFHAGLRGQLVERAGIAPADEIGAGALLYDFPFWILDFRF